MDLRNVLLVLDRPQSADNLGAVARVMKNFGLGRLAVVAPPSWAGPPRSGGPGTAREDVLRRARRLARKAGDVLDAAGVHADLRAALRGVTWACGTSSRSVEGRPSLSPEELGRELARRSQAGPVAVVFGQERRGLSDAELSLCQAVCAIPTAPAYDSMNLAQAAAVIAWEVARAGGAAVALAPGLAAPAEPARHETMEALWERLRAVLGQAGYLNPQNPDHILAELRRLLTRAEPTQREAELCVAAVRALERALRER
ncbi:MAG TPA: TrmH family RNA methyltransferase [Anaeromyxobacter sp.]